MTVEKAVSQWISLRAASLAPSTVYGYKKLLELHIAPPLGDRSVKKLKPKHISAVLTSLCDAGHTRTAQLVRVLLRASLQPLMLDGTLDRNPADLVQTPAHVSASGKFWTGEQLRAFLAASADDPFLIAWQLALVCGLRRGELLGLRWQDVDLQASVIHIRNQRQRVDGQTLDRPPKSRASRREIPIPSALMASLARHHRARLAAQLAAGPRWSGQDYVLCSPRGEPFSPETLRLAHKRAIARANVPPITLHGMRHTMATLAVSCGISIRVLQSILGHAHYSTTADIYGHVVDTIQRTALDTISTAVL